MRIAIGVLGCLLAGCVQPNVVHCADGRTCPAGTVCAAQELCALPVQLTVCIGQEEGTACAFPGAIGACIGGVCIPVGCGNGVREPTEACDDGNQLSGDGCSSDCQSNEECGDGDANPFLGEECDDRNDLDHDGCSSSCLQEGLAWSRIDNGPPLARRGAAITYDSVRGRVILFGGTGPANARYNDTWEWDGTRWTKLVLRASPPPRQSASMAFDPTRNVVVLFGGLGATALGDTWELVGTTWRSVPLVVPPPGRYGHQVVYDGVRKRVVMVGGTNVVTTFDDAYSWSGTAWEPLPALPRPSTDHAMAFDAARGRVVLFSGRASTTAPAVDDAWALDASGWSMLPAPGEPRLAAGAAYDPVTRNVLVFGGTPDGPAANAVARLTTWNGTAWTHATPGGGPSPRSAAAVTYDLGARVLVVFGGYLANTGYANDTFTFGSAWAMPPPPLALSVGGLSGIWDPDRAIGLVTGPGVALLDPTRLWRWDGGLTQLTPVGPTGRFEAMMAWNRDEMIFAGGRTAGRGAILPTDTWSWKGSWMLRDDGPPFPRPASAMATDPQGLVLFGGLSGSTTVGETWTWRTPGAWSRATVAEPTPLSAHAMAYDPRRHRTLLYGGRQAPNPPSSETWEWDGSSWLRIDPLMPSPPRANHRMYDDPNRQRLIAIGTADGNSGSDVLEWDGTAWAVVATQTAGPMTLLSQSAMFYDPVRHGAVLVADPETAGLPTEVWLLRYQSASRDESCRLARDVDQDGLVGCADPDCWYVCTPHCSPGMTCDDTLPRCGDASCNTAVEDCRSCPQDCGACTPLCGDGICDPGETCPGDC